MKVKKFRCLWEIYRNKLKIFPCNSFLALLKSTVAEFQDKILVEVIKTGKSKN